MSILDALSIKNNAGAIIPSFLFWFANSSFQVTLINEMVWATSGIAALFFVLRATDHQNFSNITTLVLLMSTTILWLNPFTASWNNAVMSESIGFSVLGLLILISMLSVMFSITYTHTFILLLYLCLAFTKPHWCVLAVPLILPSFFGGKGQQRYPIKKSALLVVPLILVVMVSNSSYALGLTYKGWQSLTQAIDLGAQPQLQKSIDKPLLDCPGLLQLIEIDRTRDYKGSGLSGNYDFQLKVCPATLKLLNEETPTLARVAASNPLGLFGVLLSRADDFTHASIYSDGANRIFPNMYLLRLYQQHLLEIVFIAGIIVGFTQRQRFKSLYWIFMAVLCAESAFLTVIDGLEPGIYVLPVTFMSLILVVVFTSVSVATYFSKAIPK